VKISAK